LKRKWEILRVRTFIGKFTEDKQGKNAIQTIVIGPILERNWKSNKQKSWHCMCKPAFGQAFIFDILMPHAVWVILVLFKERFQLGLFVPHKNWFTSSKTKWLF